MFNEGYSLADLAAATGNNDGFGANNGAWWIIILFLFCFMGGGNGFFGNRCGYGCDGKPATTDEVQNQFNFAALERQNNEIMAAIKEGAYDVTGAVKDMGYMNSSAIRDVGALVAQNGYQMSQCCCELSRGIDSAKYDALLNTQNIMQNDCQNTQKILDAITCNRMADMQNQINQLQLQSALCGVMKYPMATTYTAGFAPYIGFQGCGCNTCA